MNYVATQCHRSVSQQVINLHDGHEKFPALLCSSVETHRQREPLCYSHMTAAVCESLRHEAAVDIFRKQRFEYICVCMFVTWAIFKSTF